MVVASLWVFFVGIAYTGNCNAEASDNLKGTTYELGGFVTTDKLKDEGRKEGAKE